MPGPGDRITKRKDGRYMARFTVHTPDGPRRKTIYGKKYREVEKKLNEARANADKGLVFDADNLKLGEWLDSWLDDLLKPLVDAGKMAHSTYVRYRGIVEQPHQARAGTPQAQGPHPRRGPEALQREGQGALPPVRRLHPRHPTEGPLPGGARRPHPPQRRRRGEAAQQPPARQRGQGPLPRPGQGAAHGRAGARATRPSTSWRSTPA